MFTLVLPSCLVLHILSLSLNFDLHQKINSDSVIELQHISHGPTMAKHPLAQPATVAMAQTLTRSSWKVTDGFEWTTQTVWTVWCL